MIDCDRAQDIPNRVIENDRIADRKWVQTHKLPDRVRKNDAKRRYDMKEDIPLSETNHTLGIIIKTDESRTLNDPGWLAAKQTQVGITSV